MYVKNNGTNKNRIYSLDNVWQLTLKLNLLFNSVNPEEFKSNISKDFFLYYKNDFFSELE